MKKTIHPVALAALLIPSLLFADTVEVTFDAALTNATGWVYSSDIKSNSSGYYVSGHTAKITSPRFDFVITSAVLRVKTSNNCTRNLIISAFDPETASTSLPQTFEDIPKGTENHEIAVFWDASREVMAIALESTQGAQNLYFLSATISGVPLIAAPTGLQANNIKGSRFTLSWENPETAVSNRIDVLKVVESEGAASDLEYDFNEFANDKGSSVDITDSFTNTIPAFSGSSEIRLPASASGTIQISKDDTRGYLVHAGFADCTEMSLVVALRIPTDDHGKTFGISYLGADGSTNQFGTIQMTTEFKTNTISLASVPSNAALVFNTDGTGNSKRGVLMDYMAFVGATEANIATNVIATAFAAKSPARVRGLSPNTDYLVTVTAFDADGNESSPSEPLAVSTNGEKHPFAVHIQ